MKNILILPLALLLSVANLSANPDSLRQLIQQETDLHKRLEFVRQLGNSLTYSNPDSAMICAELALSESARLDFDDIRCAAMLDKAILLLFQGQLEDAKKWAADSEKLVAQLRSKTQEFRLFDLKGKILYKTGDIKAAIGWFEKSLNVAPLTETEPKRAETLAYIQIGNSYKALRDFGKALASYEKAERLALDHAEAANLLGFIYNNRAGVFGEIGDFRSKLDACKKGLALLNPDDYRRANLYNSIADACLNLKNRDSALYYFQETLRVPNVKSDTRLRALLELAYLLQDDGKHALSREYAEKALEEGLKNGNIVAQIDAHFVIGEAWFKENNHRKAIQSMEVARSLFSKTGEKDVLFKNANVHEKLLRYQLASNEPGMLPLFERLIQLKDSIYQQDLIAALSDYKIRAQQDSINMLRLESDVSKAQISTRNQLLAAALVILLLFTGLSFYWWRSYRLARLREQMLNEQHQTLRRANEALVQSIETPSTAEQNGDHLLDQTITFSTRDNLTLRLGDILYVKSLGGGVTYFTEKGKFHVWQTLNQSREFLPESLFMQVHRSYIVNRKQIVGRTRQHLTLSDKIKVPVGALYRDTLEG